MIDPTKYVRKAFYVEAVRVSAENMEEVAQWCNGTVCTNDSTGKNYVQVNVVRAMTPRQTRAYIGNHVVRAGAGFKVYTNQAFTQDFDPAPDLLAAV